MPGLLDEADVSRETMHKLKYFGALLKKWTASINLIAPDSVPEIWNRHIQDSWQLYQYMPQNVQAYTDLGSGGGLPGIVLAIAAQEKSSKTQITLIESDARKCTFLRTAARELGLNIDIKTSRIENAPYQPADLVTARALAPLPQLLGYVSQHISENGVALLPKGRNYQMELAEARKHWHFDCRTHNSSTDPDARILEVRDITRVTQ